MADPLSKTVAHEATVAPHPLSHRALAEIQRQHEAAITELRRRAEDSKKNKGGGSGGGMLVLPQDQDAAQRERSRKAAAATLMLQKISLSGDDDEEALQQQLDLQQALASATKTTGTSPVTSSSPPPHSSGAFASLPSSMASRAAAAAAEYQERHPPPPSLVAFLHTEEEEGEKKKEKEQQTVVTSVPVALSLGGTGRHFLSRPASATKQSMKVNTGNASNSNSPSRESSPVSPLRKQQQQQQNDDNKNDDDDEAKLTEEERRLREPQPDHFNQLLLHQLVEHRAAHELKAIRNESSLLTFTKRPQLLVEPRSAPLRGYAGAQIDALRRSMKLAEEDQKRRKSEQQQQQTHSASSTFIFRSDQQKKQDAAEEPHFYHQVFDKHVDAIVAERKAIAAAAAKEELTSERGINFVRANMLAMKQYRIEDEIAKAEALQQRKLREQFLVENDPKVQQARQQSPTRSSRKATTTTTKSSNQRRTSDEDDFASAQQASAVFSGLGSYVERKIAENQQNRAAITSSVNNNDAVAFASAAGNWSQASLMASGVFAGMTSTLQQQQSSSSFADAERTKLWSVIAVLIESSYRFDEILANARGETARRVTEHMERQRLERQRMQVQIPLAQLPQTWRTVLRLVRDYVHRFRQRRYGPAVSLLVRFLRQQQIVTRFSRAVREFNNKVKLMQRTVRRFLLAKRWREALVARAWLHEEISSLQETVDAFVAAQQRHIAAARAKGQSHSVLESSLGNFDGSTGGFNASGSLTAASGMGSPSGTANMMMMSATATATTAMMMTTTFSSTTMNLFGPGADPHQFTVVHTPVQLERTLDGNHIYESYDTVSILVPLDFMRLQQHHHHNQQQQQQHSLLISAHPKERQQWIRKFVSNGFHQRAAALAQYQREKRFHREQMKRVHHLAAQGIKLSTSNAANAMASAPKPPLRFLLPSRVDLQNAIKWAQGVAEKNKERNPLADLSVAQQQQYHQQLLQQQNLEKRPSSAFAASDVFTPAPSPKKQQQQTHQSQPQQQVDDSGTTTGDNTPFSPALPLASQQQLSGSFNSNSAARGGAPPAPRPETSQGFSKGGATAAAGSITMSQFTTIAARPSSATQPFVSLPSRPHSATITTTTMPVTRSGSAARLLAGGGRGVSVANSRPASGLSSNGGRPGSKNSTEKHEQDELPSAHRNDALLKAAWKDYIDSFKREGKPVPRVVGADSRIPPVLPEQYFVKLLLGDSIPNAGISDLQSYLLRDFDKDKAERKRHIAEELDNVAREELDDETAGILSEAAADGDESVLLQLGDVLGAVRRKQQQQEREKQQQRVISAGVVRSLTSSSSTAPSASSGGAENESSAHVAAMMFERNRKDLVPSIADLIERRQWEEETGAVCLKLTKPQQQQQQRKQHDEKQQKDDNDDKIQSKDSQQSAAADVALRNVTIPHMLHSWIFEDKHFNRYQYVPGGFEPSSKVPRPPVMKQIEVLQGATIDEVTSVRRPGRPVIAIDPKSGAPVAIPCEEYDVAAASAFGMAVAVALQEQQVKFEKMQQQQQQPSSSSLPPRPPSSPRSVTTRPGTANSTTSATTAAVSPSVPLGQRRRGSATAAVSSRPGSASASTAAQPTANAATSAQIPRPPSAARSVATTARCSSAAASFAAAPSPTNTAAAAAAAAASPASSVATASAAVFFGGGHTSRPASAASAGYFRKQHEFDNARARFFAPREQKIVSFSSLRNNNNGNVFSRPGSAASSSSAVSSVPVPAMMFGIPAAPAPLSIVALESHGRAMEMQGLRRLTQ